ncbi:MAG: homogentisate 1,2-dioxygenase [Phycisphaerales bacterium]|nr:homogentisate 1,2-dioxygenase [Phycisphaerales bacterium]
MLHRHALGVFPPKPHTAHYEDGKLLMEQMITREGFNGPFSILYYRTPPTDEFEVAGLELPGYYPFKPLERQSLHRRHIRSQDIKPGGDFLTGRRMMLFNPDVHISVAKPTEPASRFFCNGDGDELFFIKAGSGRVESLFGTLPFREHDYVLIPKGTSYRMHFDGNKGVFMLFEGRPYLGIPGEYRNRYGQLTDYAPYSHRDFRIPQEMLRFDPKTHGKPPYELVVKAGDELSVHSYQHFPLDVAGWDGCVYPFAFNIHDYQAKTALVHLPPTIHTTFSGNGFVVCSFVPRVCDWHEKAIPCPYAHASVDMDEVLYYVDGNFISRKGIESESISLHPLGVTHGPHPGMYEKSIGAKRSSELAVMCDTHKPLRLTDLAHEVEDKDYHTSWVRKETPVEVGSTTWTSH